MVFSKLFRISLFGFRILLVKFVGAIKKSR